jgi:FtsZ-binding cell division protein ZapB
MTADDVLQAKIDELTARNTVIDDETTLNNTQITALTAKNTALATEKADNTTLITALVAKK